MSVHTFRFISLCESTFCFSLLSLFAAGILGSQSDSSSLLYGHKNNISGKIEREESNKDVASRNIGLYVTVTSYTGSSNRFSPRHINYITLFNHLRHFISLWLYPHNNSLSPTNPRPLSSDLAQLYFCHFYRDAKTFFHIV